MKLKDKFLKWIKKKPTSHEFFVLLFLIWLGSSSILYISFLNMPLLLGLNGIELTNEQTMHISNEFITTFMDIIQKLNEIGLNIDSPIANFALKIVSGYLSYMLLIMYITVILAFIRCICLWIYNKKRCVKSNGGKKWKKENVNTIKGKDMN